MRRREPRPVSRLFLAGLLLIASPILVRAAGYEPPPSQGPTVERSAVSQTEPPEETTPQQSEEAGDEEAEDEEGSEAAESGADAEETDTTETTEDGPVEESQTEQDSSDADEGRAKELEQSPGESRQLSPEEQEKLEELKRKREERREKRRAKKAKEAAKREAKRLAREAKHAERLAEVRTKGYEALEAGKLDKARSVFETYRELDGGKSFEGEIGLARTELAAPNPAAAVEHALKASKATAEPGEKSAALSLAAEATLAARPRDDVTGAPQAGTEAFRHNALRYYMQAVAADPEGAAEARRALREAFPDSNDERVERFYDRFLESSESAPRDHARRLAATYEALLSGRIEGPLAVAGGIQPPDKISGPRPPYPELPSDDSVRRRLVASFIVRPDGTVSEAQVLNGIDRRRDRMAEQVFRQWRFEPARLPDGRAVEVHWVMAVNADVEPLEATADEGPSDEAGEVGQPLEGEPDGKADQ